MPGKLEIVIPVLDGGAGIVKTLEEIEDKVTDPFRILVVYDPDEDLALRDLRRWLLSPVAPEVLLVKNRYGHGTLNAIRSGFEAVDEERRRAVP